MPLSCVNTNTCAATPVGGRRSTVQFFNSTMTSGRAGGLTGMPIESVSASTTQATPE